ncbi:MAG: bifunctional riboflavin kinase/FAD synthetase [Propionibacterium sp.]|nr:bifunctional riboflavin kinase/FAD synthetase [Propionibacterium sp.]
MSVVAIGNFDGVHRGHQAVLQQARAGGLERLIVVTFWPHPVSVLRPDKAPKLLTDLQTRLELLRQAGADEVRVIHFNQAVSNMSPEEFVDTFLLPLEPNRVVVGTNFRFGHRAAGDVTVLRRLGEGQFEVEALELSAIGDETTCSTTIRESLRIGDVATAARHLGRPFQFRGLVVMGDQRGREMGFPTANLIVSNGSAVPADGVYAGWLTRVDIPGGAPMPAAISVGSNPTFDGTERRVESHVIGRDDLSLYGAEVTVDFVEHLRGQVRFEGVPALIEQMRDDVERARTILDWPGAVGNK